MSHQRASTPYRKALALALLALAVLAAGLAGPAWAQLSRSMARTIGVAVVDGRIVVSEPGATIGAGDTVVVWRLQTAGYTFAEDGVVIAGGEDAYQCELASDALSFRCSKLKAASRQRFSYGINLIDVRTGATAQLPQPNAWIQGE